MNATAKERRFEFGRHETFTVRYGWLGKGLKRLASPEGFKADTATADALGLGSRMVRSLGYWLEASGLADSVGEARSRRLETSDVGRVVESEDAFLQLPGTWWFVHLAIAGREGSAPGWFFNDYSDRTIERSLCVDAFLRHAKLKASKAPTLSTAQRDVGNVLASYAYDPTEAVDPEDGAACPIAELRLVAYHRDTRKFEKVRPVDPVPVEAFLAAASTCADGEGTVSIADLASRRRGPGRLFNLDAETIDRAAQDAAKTYGKRGVAYALHGGERRLTIPEKTLAQWLAWHYHRIGVEA